MGSTVIAIPDVEEPNLKEKQNETRNSQLFDAINDAINNAIETINSKVDMRNLIHSIKVGTALVLVSLLYFLDRFYKEVGDDNAIWAIMTVVVIFEFYAGATLGKGLNRGIGTILGGGLGCLAATLGQKVGGRGNSIVVGISVFIFGGIATYARLIPRIKKTYDYGAMIFILTFSLVAVSGFRAEEFMEIARERLIMIVLGFTICIFTSLFVFPVWSSDELHNSLVSKFEDLASSIEGCLEHYFAIVDEKEKEKENEQNQTLSCFRKCALVLYSKTKDETLANFARWEPWHGKFGLFYPWKKYLKIGNLLRELAITILSLKGCLESTRQPSESVRQSIKEPCEAVGSSLAWALRELKESIKNMRKCQAEAFVVPKLKSVRLELSQVVDPIELGELEIADGLGIATFVFLLMEMVDKLEKLVKEVEELGEFASFHNI